MLDLLGVGILVDYDSLSVTSYDRFFFCVYYIYRLLLGSYIMLYQLCFMRVRCVGLGQLSVVSCEPRDSLSEDAC